MNTKHEKNKLGLGIVFAGLLSIGLVGNAAAMTCDTGGGYLSDVTADDGGGSMDATQCGIVLNPPSGNDSLELVNTIDIDGFDGEWLFYEKVESEGHTGTGSFGLTVDDLGTDSGTFHMDNVSEPFLVILKDGEDFFGWYYIDGKSGDVDGTWTTANLFPKSTGECDGFMARFDSGCNGGKALSHLTVYTTDPERPPSEVPVPAAVWLFGSDLIGMVGVARRRRSTS